MSKCIEYSDSTPDVTFSYDRLGRQTTINDALGQRTFTYNTNLQPQSEIITGLYDKTITHTYATTGIIGRSTGYTIGTEYAMTYGYDPSGRFSSIGWTAGTSTGTASYTYLANSDLLAQMTTPTGLKTTYAYEPNRNLKTQVKNEYGAQLISQYDYQYDAIARRENVANSGTAFTASAFNNYAYNDRNELTESARYQGTDITDTTNPVQSEYRQYNYDPIGNRTEITEGTDAGSYTTNNLNQYEDQTVPANGTNTLTYDTDGNMTGITGGSENKTYTYNAENRLIAVEPPVPAEGDKKVEFTYDYMGRRVKKVVSTYTSSVWTQETEKLFVYNGWNLIEELTTSGGPQTTKYYAWGLDLSGSLQGAGGIGGLIASVDDTNTYYFYYDSNGNVGQLVDGTDGSITAHYEYDGYGNEIVESGGEAQNNTFKFSTKYVDEETGLLYFGYRYYLAEAGRWISKDPIEETGGLNLYSYVVNNPTNFTDPNGLIKWKGSATYISAGQFFGVGVLTLNLTSECYKGYKTSGKIMAIVAGGTLSLTPVGVTQSEITIIDPFYKPNLSNLTGLATIGTLSGAFMGGRSITSISVGWGESPFTGIQSQGGIDASLDIMAGYAFIKEGPYKH